jgi:hypothetical protein
MALDNMAGLFATPEQYQQAQLAQIQDQAVQMARLTPAQRASANMQVAGYQLGSGIAGAFGVQDPALQAAAMRQSILKGVDQTSATSLRDAAQKLADAGDLQGANALAQQSVAIQAKIDEKQMARESQLEAVRMRNEAMIQAARERGATQLQIAQMQVESRNQIAQLAASMKGEKAQVADDKAATRIGQNTMFDTLISEGDKLTGVIDKNKDAFTLGGRAATAVKSVMNPSAESVSAVSDVDSYMKKARNAYLLAAKGTQTEGDAQRAWDEFAGKLDFSSAEGAKRSIGRIKTELETQRQANDAYLKSRGISSGAALGTKDNPIKLK